MRLALFVRSSMLTVALAASVSSVAAAESCVVGASGGCATISTSRARAFVSALTGSTTRDATAATTRSTGDDARATTKEGGDDERGIRGVSMSSRSLALLFALGTGTAIALFQSSTDRPGVAPAAAAISDHGGTAVTAAHPPVPVAVHPPVVLHPPVVGDATHPPVDATHPPVTQATHPPVFDAHVVPEPVTMTLLATGLAGMGGIGALRRRRSAKA